MNKIDMPVFSSFKFIKPLIGSKKVLDVGCGVGRYLEHFSKDSVGLELSSESVKCVLKKKLKVIKSDVNYKFPFKSNQFEVVFASHIIEHVYSPYGFLKESKRVLKNKGIIILGFPIENSLVRVFGDHYFKDHPGHLYSFSIDGITKLLSENNFSILKIFTDLSLVNRFPFLNPLLNFFNKLPPSWVLRFSNAIWIVAKRQK